MITLAIPTYRRFVLAAACVASAYQGACPPDRVLVVDNSGGRCPAIVGAQIVPGREPQSVARAWNDAARLAGADWLILANDDTQFAPDTIQRLRAAAEANPKAGIVSPIEGLRFACFLLRRAAFEAVGPFDEQFAPAYFEDNDYARRLTLAGWELAVAPSDVRHVGSATIRSYHGPEARLAGRQFDANKQRYLAKWGGLPHEELYQAPYGGQS